MARTLVLSNRKGGSGKSASSVNVAAELAARGQRVLLIDLDTQSHCAVGLGLKLARDTPTVHGFLAGRYTLRQALQQSVWPGLHLIPADPLFDHGAAGEGELKLNHALLAEGLGDDYDTIVIDTPPSLDNLLLNALCAADRVLIPFLPHYLSGEGVRQLARVLFRVSSRGLNERLRILGFLPVMVDLRIGQHRTVNASLAHQFGAARLLPGIRTDIKVAEAFAEGKPVREHAPNSRAAADYAAVVTALEALWT
jgi:chromosome partitioning protein